jgi:hypothetical protein
MKTRKIAVTLGVVLTMCILPSCNIIEECGSCEQVTEDKDGNKTYGTTLLLCGDELKEKQNEPLETLPDGGVSYWNCY